MFRSRIDGIYTEEQEGIGDMKFPFSHFPGVYELGVQLIVTKGFQVHTLLFDISTLYLTLALPK